MLMSFHHHNSTLVLSMIRGMPYQGLCEFNFTVDHDIPYGLGYTPTRDDARHMARLR